VRINRREWLRAVGGAGAGLWAASSMAAPALEAKRPNIIYIMADDLGYGDLGCYGQTVVRTPNIDRLASEGIRFTQCYAGSTVCAPSRCSLMTGLHTGHCWIRGNLRVPLRPEDVTVASLLKDRGYSTGLIGKWGLGNEGTTGVPGKHGFDYFFGYLDQGHAHNYYPDYLWRNEERIPIPENVQSAKAGVAAKKVVYSHDLFAKEALAFVEKHQKEPFFLYLALTTPHANDEGGAATGDGMEVPDYGPYGDKDWPSPQKGQAAMITRMDRDVGKLLGRVAELGLDENTIIFFASDNGPHKEGGVKPDFFHSSGTLRGIKRDLYEGGIRVPMIVRWKGTLKAGQTSEQVWAFWDLLPTLVELAGGVVPVNIDGISITPTLRNFGLPKSVDSAQRQHEYLYWEFHEGGSKQAVRAGRWKGVRTAKGASLELYDLESDSAETKNVASEHPEVVSRIEGYLASARTENEHWKLE